MTRPVSPDEASLVQSPDRWERKGVVFRQVRREAGGMPDVDDLRAVHEVLESAFTDHFNPAEESFEEFENRLREDPGHRWDHWWLAEIVDGDGAPRPPARWSAPCPRAAAGPGSYVSYLGVLESARGRGVATGLLNTIIADAAGRERDHVGLEVDADSPTGAEGLYVAMGWRRSTSLSPGTATCRWADPPGTREPERPVYRRTAMNRFLGTVLALLSAARRRLRRRRW